MFYSYLQYFTAIWKKLWQFDIFYGRLVYFSPFWHVAPRKIWQPWVRSQYYECCIRNYNAGGVVG
jgi:hypothetical protein